MHGINKEKWEYFKSIGAPEFFNDMKKAGKIRYKCFSFHGPYEEFEYILNDYNIVTLCPNDTASPSNSGASAFGDGDFLMENQCMGGVLIRGDLIHISGTGVSDSRNIQKPSVIGGYAPVSSTTFINNRKRIFFTWKAKGRYT